MTETYYLISNWLENWKRRFGALEQEKLRELFFKKSFTNIARASVTALESHFLNKPETKIQKNQKNNWGRDLLENLEFFYTNKSLILDLLEAEHKSDIENLGKQLKKGSYDVKTIFPILERLQKGFSNKTIRKEFIDELKLNDKANEDKLEYFADALIQNNIFNHGVNSLKELPERSIARHGAALFLKKHIEKLVNDRKLGIKLWTNYIDFLSDEINAKKPTDIINSNADSVFELVKSYYWESLVRRLLKDLANIFIGEISKLKLTGTNEEIEKRITTNITLHKKIGELVLEIYAPALIKAIFQKTTSKPARDESSKLSKNMLVLGDWLKTVAKFDDNRTPPYGHRPDIVDLVNTESFSSLANDFLGDSLLKNKVIEFDEKIVSNIGRRICSWFGKEIRESNINWNSISSETLETFCTTWTARTVFHRNLGLIFSSANDIILDSLPDILKMKGSKSLLNKKKLRQEFWLQWFEKFVSYAGFNSHIYKYFPWNKIAESELEQLFFSVFNNFDKEKEEWTVIFIINRLNSKNRIWKMSDITFFDPNNFDFGERRWFPSNIAETVTFAKVNIQATTSKDAAFKGWKRLNNVLNESALILSLSKSYGGFEVDIHPDIYVAQTRTNSWFAGWSLARTDRTILQTPDAFESWVLPTMDKLFDKEKDNLLLTPLESKFVTALHWYNKGRWKKDAGESYIFFWIGIETLFGESGQEKLFPLMSNLAINWRNAYSYGFYFLKCHWSELINKISEDAKVKKIADSNSQLKKWDKNYKVLFNHKNAELLHNLIPESNKKIKDYAKGYIKYLQPFVDDESAYLKSVERMRSDFRFKLLLLKDLRNRMTHQGIFYHPEMIFYTEELQDIFENFLEKFANVAINQPPLLRNLEELIAQFDDLWVT